MTFVLTGAHNISMIKRFLYLTLISFGLALIIYLIVPSLDDKLEAQPWILSSAKDFNDVNLVEISLNFDGKVMSGNAGVNLYSASYNLNGKYLHKSPIMVTEMASMDPKINELESNYLFSLEKSQSIMFDHNELVLLDEEGIEILRFIQIQD